MFSKPCKNGFGGLVSGRKQNFGSQKRKTKTMRVIFLPYIHNNNNIMPPIGRLFSNFRVTGKIAALITHVTFYVNRFRGYGAVTPRNLGISI